MAALKKPRLLLLDEHTAALDPKTAAKVLQATNNIVNKDHLTTLMITHNMRDAIANGNRLIMLNNGKVIFGATVVLVNTDTDEEVTYQIVGDDEADIKSGLISVNSPIARGLVGKELDDTVNITTPGGTVEFEIIEVNYI